MASKSIMVNAGLAEDAEIIAEALGFDSVDEYVNHLLAQELEEFDELLMLIQYWYLNLDRKGEIGYGN